jgi:hypothetical protein
VVDPLGKELKTLGSEEASMSAVAKNVSAATDKAAVATGAPATAEARTERYYIVENQTLAPQRRLPKRSAKLRKSFLPLDT